MITKNLYEKIMDTENIDDFDSSYFYYGESQIISPQSEQTAVNESNQILWLDSSAESPWKPYQY